MAELEPPVLSFPKGCPDPGQREVKLPVPLPDIGIDFNWDIRDFESFRDAMLEEMVLRYPERRRWTSADIEVVLIEVLAGALDQLSDMADRVVAESYLESARRPESVYNWLRFIGMDLQQLYPFDEVYANRNALFKRITEIEQFLSDSDKPVSEQVQQELNDEKLQLLDELNSIDHLLNSRRMLENDLFDRWRNNPFLMEQVRRTGPANVRSQKRMTSLADYASRLEEHPLVERAYASRRWSGSWPVVWVMLSLWNNAELDQSLIVDDNNTLPETRRLAIEKFHSNRGLRRPEWSDQETIRDILRSFITDYRSIGQEVFLQDIEPVGIDIALCLQVGINYYQSEVKREVLRVLGRGPGGFFEPGRLKVGEDLHVSDFYQRLMSLDGVQHMEVRSFKKIGNLYANKADTGEIVMEDSELAICDNDPFKRERGLLSIQLYGGRRG